MPSASSSAAQSPPHTSRASSWLPSWISIAFWDVHIHTHVGLAGAIAHATSVECATQSSSSCRCHRHLRPQRNRHRTRQERRAGPAVTVAVAFWDVCTSHSLDLPARGRCTRRKRQFSDTWVYVITRCHLSQHPRHKVRTLPERRLVAVTIAVAFNDVGTSTLVDLTGAVADATSVVLRHRVYVIADAI